MSPSANSLPDFAEAIPYILRAARASSVSAIAAIGDGALQRDDLVQEALIAVWRRLGRYDSSRASLQTFVDRIVKSTIRTVLRRQRAAKRSKHDRSEEPGSVDFRVQFDVKIDIHRALRCLASLDLRVARLLLREYRPTEIARILKISRTAVYRSIERIRTYIGESGLK